MTRVPAIRESAIEAACTTLLQLDGWRPFKMEQNYSERKRKVTGEKGCADHIYIRYVESSQYFSDTGESHVRAQADVMWIEWKRLTKSGKPTKAAPHQKTWHRDERLRGALTLIAGEDFPASVDGFLTFYRNSGLMRRAI